MKTEPLAVLHKPGPAGETPSGDRSDPATLVRAVFAAIVAQDAPAYVGLTVNEPADFEDLAGLSTHPPPAKSPQQLAAHRDKARAGFEKFINELRSRGIDPGQARLVDVETDRAAMKDGRGFAEDLTAVIEEGGVRLPVTIDDCVLTRRGWLVADGLKLRQ